jgi:hypothetical protein
MNKTEFRQRYGQAIRMCFNWARFNAEAGIDVGQADSDLNSLFVPWYIDGQGGFTNWDATGATPLTVSQAALRLSSLSQHSQATIGHWVKEYQSGKKPERTPAYALPDDHYLVLDGNHRLIAAHLAGVNGTFGLDVVRGPIDDGIVFDLRYWKGKA